ncbi:MAG: cytochrome c oxidase assembly protein [bacterium]
MLRTVFLSMAAAGAARPVFARDAGPQVWTSWFDDPLVAVLLAGVLALYLAGLATMLSRPHQKWPVGKARVAAFFGALLVLALALVSPIDALAEELFSVHMFQHLLLVLAVGPLLAVSDGHLVVLRAFPLSIRRSIGRAVAGIPGIKQAAHETAAAWMAVAFFIATLWFWHIPAAYDWALGNPAVHVCEHVTLIAAAVFFWRVVLTSGDRRLSPAMAVILVTLVGVQGSFLAALIMFAPRPLYAAYAANGLDDQALAGVLMCIPASFVYLGSTIWALSRMMANGGHHAG